MTRHVTSADGTRIAVERLGQGPALVIVDGAGCSRLLGASREWAPLLSRHFTVYIYDRRGRGESTDIAPYAVEREIDDLRAVIEVAGQAPYLVGCSTGAVLTRYAVEAGVATSGVALFEPPLTTAADHRAPLVALLDAGEASKAMVYWMTNVVGMPPSAARAMRLFARRSWPLLLAAAPTLRYDLEILERGLAAPPPDIPALPTLVLGQQGGRLEPEIAASAITRFFAPG